MFNHNFASRTCFVDNCDIFSLLFLDTSSDGKGEPTPPHPHTQKCSKNGTAKVKRTVSKAQSERELTKQKKFEALLNSPPKALLGKLHHDTRVSKVTRKQLV